MLDKNRWNNLLERLTGIRPHDGVFNRIAAAYCEPHRHYHDNTHIEHCLTEFDVVKGLCESPDEFEFAIWLHDSVYDPHAADNEERSEKLAMEILSELGYPEIKSNKVRDLILITRHDKDPVTPDEQLIVDIDLSILGQPPDIYDIYENSIRAEYSWVPKAAYIEGRSNILRSFLNRPSIYYTEIFERLYGNQARVNMAEAVIALAHSAWQCGG
jgi:predicted metal-dependent HD superfamily phosphohydrolase